MARIEKMGFVKRIVMMAMVVHMYAIGVLPMKALSKVLILEAYDRFWMEHLDTMADLREGISLRNLAQRDPLVEYKNEGFQLFDDMLKKIDEFVVTRFFRVRLINKSEQAPIQTNQSEDKRPGRTQKQKTIIRSKKIGRNDPCPCGSGKKYKNAVIQSMSKNLSLWVY
jgi:preprotein translocase subunit SecA